MAARKRPAATSNIEPRKKPRQERAQATVDAILEASAQILRKHGYDGLTTNKVAEAAGVSVGSLYQYFPGKDALVTATLLSFGARQQKRLFAVLGNVQSEPISVVIRTVVRALMEISEADRELSMVLMNQIPMVGELGEVVAYFQERVTEPIRAFLEARHADLAVKNIRAAAFVLAHTIQPLMQRVQFSGMSKSERSEVYDELGEMITGYLLGRSQPAE